VDHVINASSRIHSYCIINLTRGSALESRRCVKLSTKSAKYFFDRDDRWRLEIYLSTFSGLYVQLGDYRLRSREGPDRSKSGSIAE
jgi:hypothetical protein